MRYIYVVRFEFNFRGHTVGSPVLGLRILCGADALYIWCECCATSCRCTVNSTVAAAAADDDDETNFDVIVLHNEHLLLTSSCPFSKTKLVFCYYYHCFCCCCIVLYCNSPNTQVHR